MFFWRLLGGVERLSPKAGSHKGCPYYIAGEHIGSPLLRVSNCVIAFGKTGGVYNNRGVLNIILWEETGGDGSSILW